MNIKRTPNRKNRPIKMGASANEKESQNNNLSIRKTKATMTLEIPRANPTNVAIRRGTLE